MGIALGFRLLSRSAVLAERDAVAKKKKLEEDERIVQLQAKLKAKKEGMVLSCLCLCRWRACMAPD